MTSCYQVLSHATARIARYSARLAGSPGSARQAHRGEEAALPGPMGTNGAGLLALLALWLPIRLRLVFTGPLRVPQVTRTDHAQLPCRAGVTRSFFFGGSCWPLALPPGPQGPQGLSCNAPYHAGPVAELSHCCHGRAEAAALVATLAASAGGRCCRACEGKQFRWRCGAARALLPSSLPYRVGRPVPCRPPACRSHPIKSLDRSCRLWGLHSAA